MLRGGNNKTVKFDDTTTSELIMDNLDHSGRGTSHGIVWLGSGDANSLVNPRIRWANYPSYRSTGDGIRVVGYPSDVAPPDRWTYSTGGMTNFRLENWSVKNAPQVGAIFMGCSNPFVSHGVVSSTRADGLHFNACRRPVVSEHESINTGDDGLAFVTYYDSTAIWTQDQGPFNQPSVGEWSNSMGSAVGFRANGGSANGVRISGAAGISLSAPKVSNKSVGITVDSAIANRTSINFTYQASTNVKISSANVTDCAIGVQIVAQNVDNKAPESFWNFGVTISDPSVSNCTNWSFLVISAATIYGTITGIKLIGNVTAYASGVSGGKGGMLFRGIRKCTFGALSLTTSTGAQIAFLGLGDTSQTNPVAKLGNNEVTIQQVSNTGGNILLSAIAGLQCGRVQLLGGLGKQLLVDRCPGLRIDQIINH